MEQALASDMWGTLHFRVAYREMAKKFYELTDDLEWETSHYKDVWPKSADMLQYLTKGQFDKSIAVSSVYDAGKTLAEAYHELPFDKMEPALVDKWARFGHWLNGLTFVGALSEISYSYTTC